MNRKWRRIPLIFAGTESKMAIAVTLAPLSPGASDKLSAPVALSRFRQRVEQRKTSKPGI
jgi:hypothetical protein